MAKDFKTLSDTIMSDPARAARVAEHEAAMRDSLALGALRADRGLTQARVSTHERQDDLYLSTLESSVQALGGTLSVQTVFPDQAVDLAPAKSSDAHHAGS